MSNLTAGPEQPLNELRERIYGNIDQMVADALKESDTQFKNMNLKYDVDRMMAIHNIPFIMALMQIGTLACFDILNLKHRVVK
jgi:hypothetical protein